MNINPESAKDILCKNILIYGYCKFENKGCAFSHTTKQAANGAAAGGANGVVDKPGSVESKRKFNLNTPSFQPSGGSSVQGITNKFANLSPKLKEIPVFVPSAPPSASSNVLDPKSDKTSGQQLSSIKKFNTSTPSFTPSAFSDQSQASAPNSASSGPNSLLMGMPNSSQSQQGPQSIPPAHIQLQLQQQQQQQQQLHLPQLQQQIPPTPPPLQQQNPYLNNAGPVGTPGGNGPNGSLPPSSSDYMYQASASSYPLNYHLYAPAPPPRLSVPLLPHETNATQMFITNDLRENLQKKNEATLQTLPRSNLPDHISVYHSLVPIDNSFDMKSKVWDVPTNLFKVFSNIDGNAYALRKIENASRIRIINEAPFKTIKKWRSINCANIVHLQDAFTSMSFGEETSNLIVIYDYYPNSTTLLEQHVTRKLGGKLEPLTEEVLWNYIIQITNALMTIHARDLAARSSLALSKIIVTNKNRIRLSSVGIDDILLHDEEESKFDEYGFVKYTNLLKIEDIKLFGKLLYDLITLSKSNVYKGLSGAEFFNYLKKYNVYSSELIRVIEMLNTVESSFDLAKFNEKCLSPHLMKTINGLQDGYDSLESQLSSELENARLFRLITKINFVIDRPEGSKSSNMNDFNENNNKYIVKLFKDYIFNQYDEFGKPVVDLSKVLINLNKLDAGIEEKILLVSRDDKSCIIVSYKEIRDIVDSLFRSLIT